MSHSEMPAQKSALNVVMGAMTFGEPGTWSARVHDLKDVEAILDAFRAHGHTEIDTARVYSGGTSEEYLGKIDWEGKGLKLETKLYPTIVGASGVTGANFPQFLKQLEGRTSGISSATAADPVTHTPEDLRKHLLQSLKALNAESLETWYLHAPDRTVPYEVTLKAVDNLYKEGYFKRFGISNYAAWEVAEIVGICKANGYILPTAYQEIYNAIHRVVEPELFPCLRKFGISFYGFNPLGGGFFTGRYNAIDDAPEAGSRFDPEKVQGKNYRKRYWNEPYFKAIAIVHTAAEAHNLTLPEVALRWVSHHSLLKRDHGDAVLIGASSLKHIEQNLLDLEKGPLLIHSGHDVVKALDEAWLIAQPQAFQYFQ